MGLGVPSLVGSHRDKRVLDHRGPAGLDLWMWERVAEVGEEERKLFAPAGAAGCKGLEVGMKQYQNLTQNFLNLTREPVRNANPQAGPSQTSRHRHWERWQWPSVL